MILEYHRLTLKSVTVNQFLSPIVNILTIYALPIMCICFFISIYADIVWFNIIFPFMAVTFAMTTCTLLIIAAMITSKGDRIYVHLMEIACVNHKNRSLDQTDRLHLQLMIEDLGSEHHSLALYTMTGHKYTTAFLIDYIIETCLEYFLLMTFNQHFKLTEYALK